MNRQRLIAHVELYKSKLGGAAAVARRIGISSASLSTLLAGKYGANEAQMLQKIAKELDYRESAWQVVPTLWNYRTIQQVCKDAQDESMWFCISNKAGSGKTGTMEDMFNCDKTGRLSYIRCERWNARQFLIKLIEQIIGELPKGYKTVAQLTDIAVGYFNDMSLDKPLLMIDEADKLLPSALCLLIPIYNRTEDRLGLILSGSENLEKEICAGVRHHRKGYDELESRFGRSYINLRGASEQEIYDICQANGLTDEMSKLEVWGSLEKTKKLTKVKTKSGYRETEIDFVEDLRRVKRIVKSKLLINKATNKAA
jgi:transcriptional regulator with XRE-family HTH domain